jgi:hypothetical protein
MGVEPNTAGVLGRFEPRREYPFADGFCHPGQQVKVHAAHEVALLIALTDIAAAAHRSTRVP